MYFLAKAIEILLSIYIWMIIFRAIISWASPYSKIPLAGILFRLTDPFLGKIRQLLPFPRMAFDITPLIAILILIIIRHLVLAALV
jgi:YggT family protein